MTIKSLVGFTQLSESIDTVGKTLSNFVSLLAKVLAATVTINNRLSRLEETLTKERDRDREFVMSVVTLLTANKANTVVKLEHKHVDPFEELPLGHVEGMTMEELGVYQQKTEV